MLKQYFLTGLAILLPAIITIMILVFFVSLVTAPFVDITASIFTYYGIFHTPFLFLKPDQVVLIMSRIIVFFGLIGIIFAVGFLGRLIFVRYLGYLGDYLIHRIPLINKIYKAVQDVVHTLFNPSKETKFSRVVLVPFPHAGMRSIGLVTQTELPEGSNTQQDKISVFVPGTPNPSMGFMLLYKNEETIPLDMKVDEALKFLISCGVILPNFKAK